MKRSQALAGHHAALTDECAIRIDCSSQHRKQPNEFLKELLRQTV